MEELPIVALGCLLHDIGKIIQRADESPMKQSHSKFGYEFLQRAELNTENQNWQWVLESVRFHHWKDIKEGLASLPIAWFAYEADNLASAHDRRNARALFDSEDNRVEEIDNSCSDKWDRFQRLDSIFTNFKRETQSPYECKLPLWFRKSPDAYFVRDVYPYPESTQLESTALESYQILRDKVLLRLVRFLKTQNPSSVKTVNAVLHYLEENLSMVPPDTYKAHTNDVSLFDHLKLTAAIGSCMYAYVGEKHADWLTKPGKQIPWERGFRAQPAYRLVKADMSGVQEFIYNISSKAALKGLRGRSFYLELLQSHFSDQILLQLNLSRANLLYQGGGGFVLLVPNTEFVQTTLSRLRARFNEWLFDTHKGRLFMALESVKVTGEQLRAGNDGGHSMASAWAKISEKIAAAKSEKFKDNLAKVFEVSPHVEECLICHRDDLTLVERQSGERDVCPLCRDLINIGGKLPEADFAESGGPSAELFIRADNAVFGLLPKLNEEQSAQSFRVSIERSENVESDGFVLHNFDLFRPPKLFWSLYQYEDNEFQQFAEAAEGVKRIAILRADVDNLGAIFSGKYEQLGLPRELRSVSRDAAVSRALAKFFSHYLDDLLRQNQNIRNSGRWALTTVYSGGDDVFLVGAWNQVIEFAMLLEKSFRHFTCGALSLSAGIAIRKPKYPFYRLAQEAFAAEHTAKSYPGKNRLCVRFDERFSDGSGAHTFCWDEWSAIIKPLVETIQDLSGECHISRAFWNDLLGYARTNALSFYRLLYNVARAEESNREMHANYKWQAFKRDWIVSLGTETGTVKKNRLETAINWYLLLTREGRQPENDVIRHVATRSQ
jgi:CRISPR-associated protein Csm1